MLAYLTGGGPRSYWLASAATAVAMPPSSTLLVNGLAASQYYLKDGLARLGVVVEVARAGGYKTAPEPFTRTGPSPESTEMTSALLDDVFDRLVADVAAARKLERRCRPGAHRPRRLLGRRGQAASGWWTSCSGPTSWRAGPSKATGRSLDVADGYDPAPRRQARTWGAARSSPSSGWRGPSPVAAADASRSGWAASSGAESVVDQLEEAASLERR